MVFVVTSSPYAHSKQSTHHIMLLVILACIPGILSQWYFFGYGNLIQISIAVIVALLTEGLAVALRKQPVFIKLADNSAILTAILLGICLPPFAPWWLVVIGTVFAIIIAKQIYGGLGQNPFNPAMVGYVALLISFPSQMTNWPAPLGLHAQPIGVIDSISLIFNYPFEDMLQIAQINVDGMTQATPLDTFKTGMLNIETVEKKIQPPFYTQLEGIGWLWINIAFLIGGLFLLWKKIISWQIPISFLATLTLCSFLGWLFIDDAGPPMLHLFSGATMLGAFFIATDPVTAASTSRGRLIFGTLIAALVWLIRTKGGYPDAIAFAVLLANMTVPLIDHYTQPRTYGHR